MNKNFHIKQICVCRTSGKYLLKQFFLKAAAIESQRRMNEMTHNFRFEIDYGHEKKLEGVIAALNCRLMAHCHIKKVFKKFLLFFHIVNCIIFKREVHKNYDYEKEIQEVSKAKKMEVFFLYPIGSRNSHFHRLQNQFLHSVCCCCCCLAFFRFKHLPLYVFFFGVVVVIACTFNVAPFQ